MKKLRKRTTVYAFLFLTLGICLMVTVMLRRNYTVADDSGRVFIAQTIMSEVAASSSDSITTRDSSASAFDTAETSDFSDATVAASADAAVADKSASCKKISLTESDALDAPTFFLPLPEHIHFESVTFENHFLEHTLAIRIKTDSDAFLEDCEVIARAGLLSDARYAYDESARLLTIAFTTNTLTEFFPVYTNGTGVPVNLQNNTGHTDMRASNAIVVTCQSPAVLYDNIIVVDPISPLPYADTQTTVHQPDETDLTSLHAQGASASDFLTKNDDAALMLAKEIQAQAATLGNGTRVYITRTNGNTTENDLILNLIHESGAVKYLALMLPEGDVSLRASAYFNDRFYIRGYGNLQLAADAEQSLSALDDITLTGVYATKKNIDANKTSDTAAAEAVLDALKIPGAMLRIDGLSAMSQEDGTRLFLVAAALLKLF